AERKGVFLRKNAGKYDQTTIADKNPGLKKKKHQSRDSNGAGNVAKASSFGIKQKNSTQPAGRKIRRTGRP
ncbi:MAG: hypothetical protein J7K65_08450, partial [Planctomycetes bacterium]|nr:hypothetical protein [Planctomycetota bacterium]